ncbi:solute carrier family 2, facilitated glucose transporter member 3-like [Chelonus insularis]|uniref:solute carrier family 2, facilitated glucose transporter member 3-like n=1 Tax=Chelonus insularis TaxID=460826 RepID=UPI00158E0FC3|nr:solute carrier family 2, facilitated glucose transporter member 3-like [Chelonus insularis]
MAPENDASTLCLESSTRPSLLNKQNSQDENEKQSHSKKDSGKWTPLLILAGFTCCFGSAVPTGYNIGVVNNPAELIQNFINESIRSQYNKQLLHGELEFIWSVIVSIFLIGGVIGSFGASWLADKYGRKGAFMVGNIFGVLGAICFSLTPIINSVEILILGRLLVGFSGGIATSLLSMYMMEIATVGQRGAVGVLCQLGITVGVFLGQVAGLENVLGTEESWHIMLTAFAPLCIISLVLFYFLPESPKYLYIIRQEPEKATQELARLRNVHPNLLHDEICSLQEESLINSSMDSWTVGRVIKDSSVRLPILLVSALQLGQQLSGINAVFYYSHKIFEAAQLSKDDSEYGILGTGVINIAMAVISVRIMSLFGRRTLFLCSSYASAICLTVLCIGLSVIEYGSFVPWLCIIAVEAYVLFYGLGLGPIPYFIASELFDVPSRPAAMAIGSVCNWGGNFAVGLLFPTVANIMGAYTYLIFVFIIIIVAMFVKFYLPETRGVNTTDITAALSQGFHLRRRPIN